MAKKKILSENVVMLAISCLTIIQVAAMWFGVNGTLRTMVAVLIAGLAGFYIPNDKKLFGRAE